MSFQRYLTYKDSGVEWLGEVPKHWEVDRLKRSTVSAKNGIWGDEAQHDENDIPCVRVADFDRQGLRVELSEPTIRNVIEKERVGRVLTKGDLLLEKSGGGETQPVGCVVLYDDPRQAVCSNFVARVQTAPGMDSSFWRYVHAAAYAVRLNTRSIKQTSGIQNLDASQYFDERAGFPSFAEQTQIAAFLDRETAKIDGLVAGQRRLMELLKEKRQAVISHAVTQGLNAHAPMKPSDIEWLGYVPAHWRIGAIKYFVLEKKGAIKTGPFGSHLISSDMQTGTIKVYNQRSVIDGDFESGDTFISDEKFSELASFETFPGDLLITTRGTIGRAAILPENAERGILHPCLLRLQPDNSQLDTKFLQTLIQESDLMKTQLSYLSNATTIEVIYSYTIASVIIPVPPLAEQDAIMLYLADQTAKFDTLTAEAQRAIDLLQERRTALISAAVTGQIDVRVLVPAEVDEAVA